MPDGKLLLVGQKVVSLEQVAEVSCNDAVGRSQTWHCNYTDICAWVNDVAIGKALQIHLVIHNTSVGFEGSNQGAEVVPTAEDYKVVAGQDSLRDVVVNLVKDADDIGSGDTNGSRYWVPSGAGSVGGGGGSQQTNYSANTYGGNGDTYIGGGGGFGQPDGTPGTSAMRIQVPYPTPTDYANLGVPNGAYALGTQAGGGLLSRFRPDLLFYGDGGDGNQSATLVTGIAGKQGAIFIWYNRP